MTQNNVNYSEDMSGAELLDDFITKSQENVLTSNSGLQRPSYAKEGTVWLDKTSSPWVYKMFDGTDDIIIGKFDANNNRFIPSDPMTTAGDLIVEGEDGNPTRLAPGIAGTVLTSNGAGQLPSYQKSDYQLVSNMEQSLSQSTDKYPSSKLVNDELNKKISVGYESVRIIDCSNTTEINLQDTDEIIGLNINDNSVINFKLDALTHPKSVYTTQIYLMFPNGIKTVTLSASEYISWINNIIPDFSSGKSHWLVLRHISGASFILMSDAGENY